MSRTRLTSEYSIRLVDLHLLVRHPMGHKARHEYQQSGSTTRVQLVVTSGILPGRANIRSIGQDTSFANRGPHAVKGENLSSVRGR